MPATADARAAALKAMEEATGFIWATQVCLNALASSHEVREALVALLRRGVPCRRFGESCYGDHADCDVDAILAALAGTSGTEAG